MTFKDWVMFGVLAVLVLGMVLPLSIVIWRELLKKDGTFR